MSTATGVGPTAVEGRGKAGRAANHTERKVQQAGGIQEGRRMSVTGGGGGEGGKRAGAGVAGMRLCEVGRHTVTRGALSLKAVEQVRVRVPIANI